MVALIIWLTALQVITLMKRRGNDEITNIPGKNLAQRPNRVYNYHIVLFVRKFLPLLERYFVKWLKLLTGTVEYQMMPALCNMEISAGASVCSLKQRGSCV